MDEEEKKRKQKPTRRSACPCCGSSDAIDPRATAPSANEGDVRGPAGGGVLEEDEDENGVLRDSENGATYAIETVIGEGGFSRVRATDVRPTRRRRQTFVRRRLRRPRLRRRRS